jgi:hypothetical protein
MQSHEINIHKKIEFNVNGITIHFTLAIPLKKKLNKLEAL